METIIVATDFSASSINALNYAAAFARAYHFNILLVRIYTIPATYTAEGLGVVTINDALESDKEALGSELARIKREFPEPGIEARMVVGGFLEVLKELKNELNPPMLLMGAIGEYAELSMWDENWINALIDISCPVLVIPRHNAFSPIRNIALANDYKKACLPYQAESIKYLLKITGATLHVVHVTTDVRPPAENENAATLKEIFKEVQPHYHVAVSRNIIRGISDFVDQHHIDILIVTPHKYGIWDRLFHRSYTKQLARLNHLPVMAIHED